MYKHAKIKKAVIDEIKAAKPEDWKITSTTDEYGDRYYSFRRTNGDEDLAYNIKLTKRTCEIEDFWSERYGAIEEYLTNEEAKRFLDLRPLLSWEDGKSILPLVDRRQEKVLKALDKQITHTASGTKISSPSYYDGMLAMATAIFEYNEIEFDGSKHQFKGYRREGEGLPKDHIFTWQEVLDGKAKEIKD